MLLKPPTRSVVVYSEKNISDLFPVGEKINVLKSDEKTQGITMYGVVVKKEAIIENPNSQQNKRYTKTFCVTVRVYNGKNYALKSGEKVIISRAERVNPLKRFF